MKPISELTYLVLARSAIHDFDINMAIDWAYEMVALGYDTPNLLFLAATSKPANYFEVSTYLENALKELGLREKSEEEALASYGYYHVLEIARGEDVQKNLGAIRYLHSDAYQALLINFFLLNWAWGDLNYGNREQEYWPGATQDNIEGLVIAEANRWLEEHNEFTIIIP